jgi:hypothetical protein
MSMKKIKIRCWQEIAGCAGEDQQPVYFTVSDFYDAHRLYTCPNYGALFANDPSQETYLDRKFDEEKSSMTCPECQTGLADVLAYPRNYRNERTGEIEHFDRLSRTIPADEQSIILELWNPLA